MLEVTIKGKWYPELCQTQIAKMVIKFCEGVREYRQGWGRSTLYLRIMDENLAKSLGLGWKP